MPALVTDASVVMAWLLDDERGAPFEEAAASLPREGAVVPPHWHYEVRNALLIAVRRDRLSRPGALERIRLLGGLNLSTDTNTDLDATLSLSFEYRLTFYDALYLELASRRRLSLASLDGDLIRAARTAGVEVTSV